MNRKVSLTLIIVLLTASMLACQFSGILPTGAAPAPVVTPTTSTMPALAPAPASAPNLVNQQDKLVTLYQAVNPGVVTIIAGNALGSGWVYNADGIIVTNAHVVGTETRVEVDFPTGNKVYGKVLGADQGTDLAAIKVDVPADQLHPLALGDSDTLLVGQTVAAIGDPELLLGSMTTGIISAVGRSQPSNAQAGSTNSYFTTGDIIQTDALLNHGNSGGPLLNLDGQVVGVNWAVQVDTMTGASSGIGYAISINTVKRVVPELIQTGRFNFPWLGITMQDKMYLGMISALGLKSTTGAYVVAVTPNGPAEKAGVKAGTVASSIPQLNSGGDLIVAVDGHPVQLVDDLMRYVLLNKSPGDTITLTVLRGDQKVDLKLVLGVRP